MKLLIIVTIVILLLICYPLNDYDEHNTNIKKLNTTTKKKVNTTPKKKVNTTTKKKVNTTTKKKVNTKKKVDTKIKLPDEKKNLEETQNNVKPLVTDISDDISKCIVKTLNEKHFNLLELGKINAPKKGDIVEYIGANIDLPYGDLSYYPNDQITLDKAKELCKTNPECTHVYKRNSEVWIKKPNNNDWLIGSPEWGKDIIFTSDYADYDNNKGDALGPVDSFDKCYDAAKQNNYKYFNYNKNPNNKNDKNNCLAIKKGNSKGDTYFYKKY